MSGLMWVTCTVRQAFHPGDTGLASMGDAELWWLPGAWLVFAAVWLRLVCLGRAWGVPGACLARAWGVPTPAGHAGVICFCCPGPWVGRGGGVSENSAMERITGERGWLKRD